MNDLAHAPAVVTEVSCPSFAGIISEFGGVSRRRHTHVWGNEHPLWELVVREICVEHGKVLQFGQTILIRCDRVVADKGASKISRVFPRLRTSYLCFRT